MHFRGMERAILLYMHDNAYTRGFAEYAMKKFNGDLEFRIYFSISYHSLHVATVVMIIH